MSQRGKSIEKFCELLFWKKEKWWKRAGEKGEMNG
jgi:hypothetical protein